MRVIPVIDLLGGIVVRGVAGKRDEYRPVESRLLSGGTGSVDALSVARAFRDQLGLDELYVADLDAILHDEPNRRLYSRLAEEGFPAMIDAGLRDEGRAQEVIESGASAIVAGLETSAGPEQLGRLCERFGPQRVVFSLDLKDGRPLGDGSGWSAREALAIAHEAVEAGIERMIVLDLAGVGVGRGPATTELCRRLAERHPHLRLITGGGVRDAGDLQALRLPGVEGVLVASALHDGRIGRREIEALGNGQP